MASRTAGLRLLSLSRTSIRFARQCQTGRVAGGIAPAQRILPAWSRPSQALEQRRWHANPVSKSKVYDFASIKSLTTTPTPTRILLDVREPSEYTAGYIPTALNLPLKSSPEALYLPADEFEERFGFPKPKVDQEVVFYCRSGVRSSAAAGIAAQVGYEKVGEYRGSWLDWEKQGGERGK